MAYSFYKNDGSLIETYCQLNNIQPADLDTAGFSLSSRHKCLLDFKDKLLALRSEKILIVGDYDCDGICATTIMKRLLDTLKITSNYYIPSRIREGYGLNPEIVERAARYDFKVIICVDNGVSASEGLKKARELGINVMIVDHHEYSERPDCLSFVHPDLLPAPYNDLCGGGLCYLISDLFYKDKLSLVYGGLATLADMVSVYGFNRWLLRQMLDILNRDRIYQVDLLCDRRVAVYDYDDLSFNVIPKINAISRMEPLANVNMMVRYLLSDYQNCLKAAADIRKINDERKRLTNEAVLRAREVQDDGGIICIIDDSFHEGILGVVANRFMNDLHRPVVVLTRSLDGYKGSGRSPEGADLFTYLSSKAELFSQFGGHCQAVGFTVKEDRLTEFRDYVRIADLNCSDVSVIVANKDQMTTDTLKQIELLKPFGSDLKEPLLYIGDVTVLKKTIMAEKYPKYLLDNNLNAISFNESHKERDFSGLIGYLRRDSFRKSAVCFMIEELWQ